MQIAQQLQDIAKAQAELNAKRALLEVLPQDLDVEHLFPSGGRWLLTVNGCAQDLLELLPPSNARMSLNGGTWVGEPEDRSLDWNQRVLAVFSSNSSMNWFYKAPSGEMLEVRAKGARLPLPAGYAYDRSVNSTIVVRQVRHPDVPMAVSPETAWSDKWNAFFEAEGYSALQKMFARTLRMLPSKDRELTFDMLPLPVASVMQLGDDTLTILRGTGSCEVETMPEGSPFHSLSRIGHFWNCFTKAQAERLIAFANTQRCNLAQRQDEAIADAFSKVHGAIAEFQSKYLDGGVASAPIAEVLTQWVRETTGFPVRVSINKSPYYNRNPGTYDLWLDLWTMQERATIRMPAAYTKDGFDFSDPKFYTYESNDQRFFEERAVPA